LLGQEGCGIHWAGTQAISGSRFALLRYNR
jgi:hypothetical protein